MDCDSARWKLAEFDWRDLRPEVNLNVLFMMMMMIPTMMRNRITERACAGWAACAATYSALTATRVR